MTELATDAITSAARDWLAHTQAARVLNVFERACNLVNDQGEVLAVVTSERGLTPFALVVRAPERAPFRGLTETSAIRVTPGELQLGSLCIPIAGARLWDPAPDWPEIRAIFSDPSPLAHLAALAAGQGPQGSLLELFDTSSRPKVLLPALRSRAQAGARELVDGMRSGALELAHNGARRLAGLGGGLTPSGDDFILGVLLAAWAGLFGPGAEQRTPALAEGAAPRTTTLSGAYLRAAARGECSAYWHDLFAALQGQDGADLGAALAALLAVGHTSGADALAGFLAAGGAALGLNAASQTTTTGV